MVKEKNEKLYLENVFDFDEYIAKGKKKLFVASGVCSRKSTYVKDVLTKKGNVLFVTSRRAKVDEDENNSDFSNKFEWYLEDNQYLVTNAGIATRIKISVVLASKVTLNEFLNHFDYVVIDEAHSLATDSIFAPSSYDVLSFIEYVVEIGKPILAMTGTPEPIQSYFEEQGWEILDFRKICNYVHPKEVRLIRNRQVLKYIKEWNHQIVYFANHTNDMIKLCEQLLTNTDIKANEIAVIVSQDRTEEFNSKLNGSNVIGNENVDLIKMTSEETYRNIIEKQLLPDYCKILISTSTLREGIDIENKNMILFCENHVLTNIIQFFGRVRGSAEVAYIIDDSNDHIVNIDDLLYKHAKTIVDKENEFLHKEIDLESIADLKKKNRLIYHVTKDNPYLRYDYINDKYNVFDMRYKEQQRLLKNKHWKEALVRHCDEYGIPHKWFYADEWCRNSLEYISLHKNYRFFGEEQQLILNLLETGYGIKDKQIEKINSELSKRNTCIHIESRRDYSKNAPKRGATYWVVENTKNCTDFFCSYI